MFAENITCKILLTSLLVVFLLIGCGNDTDTTEEVTCRPPELTPLAFGPGPYIPINSCISVTFDRKADYAEITVSDATGTTHISRGEAIWTPDEDMSYGRHLVTVHHATSGSIKMKEPSSFPFITSDPDYTPPNIVDEKCDPKNGALDVNPDDYPQRLAIVFSEDMIDLEVASVEPNFGFTDDLRYLEDGVVLYIEFVDYKMPYDTELRIVLDGTDYSRNGLVTNEYWFRTKKQ